MLCRLGVLICVCVIRVLFIDVIIMSMWYNYVVFTLYLLSTTSAFMAVNPRGRGRSPEAKDGLRLP